MTAATVDDPLLWPRGYHTLGPGLSCVDCGWDWPCPPYQAMMRRVYGSDIAALVEFMTSLLPAANRAALHLPAGQVQDQLLGWCTKAVPEPAAPQTVAGRPLPQPRRVPPPPHRRPATPTHPHERRPARHRVRAATAAGTATDRRAGGDPVTAPLPGPDSGRALTGQAGDDLVRQLVAAADPMDGQPFPPPPVTAAELRARVQTRPSRRTGLLWWTFERGRVFFRRRFAQPQGSASASRGHPTTQGSAVVTAAELLDRADARRVRPPVERQTRRLLSIRKRTLTGR